MSKKYIILVTLAAVALYTTSCKKDFLEVTPNTSQPASGYWKTANDAAFGINSLYGQMAKGESTIGLYGGPLIWLDDITDDGFWLTNANATSIGDWAGLANGTETPTGSNSYHNRVWPAFFKLISRSNNAIAKIQGINMDEALKKRFIAEAKFFRAYAYSKLSAYYGAVPLLLKAPEDEDPLPKRAPYDDVRAQIAKDLNEAAADLPNSYTGADVGRATKGAALTCLMESYMFDSKWAEATAAAQQVMGLGYTLLPNYSDLWKYGNKETKESIFEVHFGSANGSNYADWCDSDFPPTSGGGGGYVGWGGFYTPQQQLVNEYENAIDTDNDGVIDMANKFDPATITSLFDINQYIKRDPRLAASIWYNKADYFGVPYDPNWFDLGSGYHWKKGNSAPAIAFPFGVPDYNTIIYRYAYVKLGYAESQNEAVGPDASVYKEVNDVRNRVGMPSLAPGLSKDQMRDAIRHERRVEFAGENHRYEDLRRWGKWKDAIQNRGINNGRQKGNLTIADFRNLWPIPYDEMLANPNMEQNPGY